MEECGRKLSEAIARLGRQRRNDPVPEPLRGEVLVYTVARRKLGATWQAIAQELGLSASGLQRWSARASGETRLRRVRVGRGPTQAPSTPRGAAGSLVLISPQGFRLEGLGVSEALALLHDLG